MLINMSYKGWQQYESGDSIPGGKVLAALSKLGFNINWILTGEGHIYKETPQIEPENAGVVRDRAVESTYSVVPAEIQPIFEAFMEVMTSNDRDTKLALTQNVFTFQRTVRNGEEISALKQDMDVIKKRLLEPMETDFKTQKRSGGKD